MLRRTLFVILAAALVVACNSTAKQGSQTEAEKTTGSTELKGKTFGAAFSPDGSIDYSEMAKQMDGRDSVELKIQGTVQEVCQMKGCWMLVASDDSNQEPVMVRFKDYGFFMPKDIAGRKVVMEGWAFREVTPVDELRHYAEDAGKSQEEIDAITEPKDEMKFLASGVLLLDEQ
ncbi:MAG: DUF4920 domain-containing protein [Phaeodactylibacter sp.]|nr:DUF4920 domain-containing protein [Phaeodactylibacter sp.]MCB9048178.1 DUF4920 domain-containing protein [Lewinellaceae bacterium]